MMSSPRISVLVALVGWFAGAVTNAGAEAPAAALSLDEALGLLKSYNYDQPRQPVAALELLIARTTADPQAKGDVAARLGALLADPATSLAAKEFVCEQLLVVGDAQQVPTLAKLLDDPQTTDMARRALEGIPGEESLQTLRSALGKLKGSALAGAANSLGARRDAQSVGALAKLFGDADEEVASAAARALGRIGTTDAAAALAQATMAPKLLGVLRDSQLRCAQNLAKDGNGAAAASLCRSCLTADTPAQWRMGALSGLAEVDKDSALQIVVDLLDAPDFALYRPALRIAAGLPGQRATEVLTKQLPDLAPARQADLIDILAERGDRSAAGAVTQLAGTGDEAVRVAALRALGSLGDASTVDLLLGLAATGAGSSQEAARASLTRLTAPEVDRALMTVVAEGEPGPRVEAICALTARNASGATPALLSAVDDGNPAVRAAALSALGVIGEAGSYARLLQALVAGAEGAEGEAASKAVLAVGGRMPDLQDRVGPVVAALKGAPAESKPALLATLAAYGGPQALAAVRACLTEGSPDVQTEAVRALASWPDAAPADDLLGLARDSKEATHRTLALRGYLRLVAQAGTKEERVAMLQQVRSLAATTATKNLLLSGLAGVADAAALDMALSFMSDQDVHAEAAAATLKIAKALLQSDRDSVLEPMKRLAATSKDEAIAKEAQALYAEALKQPSGNGARRNALQPDQARSEAYRKALTERAPEGYHLACYLDCGPDTADGKEGEPTLRLVDGQPYVWSGGGATDDLLRQITISYAGEQVTFAAAGLDPQREYQVGFSWWDYDHDTRAQSVWASAGLPARRAKLLDKTNLPPAAEKPVEKLLPLPRDLTAEGAVQLAFRNEGAPNVVVSEVWLWESDAQSEVKVAVATDKPDQTRVLLVTGVDLHNWRETTPVLVAQLEKDKRLRVEVVEDPNFLVSPKIRDYPGMVMHWMNWEVPAPGEDARANFRKYVEDGGGLVLVHFACGAFQDWPEFRNIAGRVWDPKLRGHDPHGEFQVDLTEVDHPITRGLKAFSTIDELYTCLTGDKPIEVLATATSKVDQKVYPMAFVHECGKGRVFHCVLGHDANALKPDAVGELFRRGTAWAAKLEPVAEAQ